MHSFFILQAASPVLTAAASQNLVTSALDKIVKLRVRHETAADHRTRELARIRQLFVPELILRLYTHLVSSRTQIPSAYLCLLSCVATP